MKLQISSCFNSTTLSRAADCNWKKEKKNEEEEELSAKTYQNLHSREKNADVASF
jgi:hypothetical protein